VPRREALARYFDYSMSEGDRRGRLVAWPHPSIGAAAWFLPAASSLSDAESDAKAAFLTEVIGPQGAENDHRIIDFMRPRASAVIDNSACHETSHRDYWSCSCRQLRYQWNKDASLSSVSVPLTGVKEKSFR
jgi:hypothetical protein